MWPLHEAREVLTEVNDLIELGPFLNEFVKEGS
jgi:hypothetical protein